MEDKIIVEKSDMSINYYDKVQSHLIPFPEIERHLSEGWVVKQIFLTTWGLNGVANASDLILTVHVQKT